VRKVTRKNKRVSRSFWCQPKTGSIPVEEEEGANNEGFVTDTLITWTSRSLGTVELDNLHALKELESFQNCI
jgi:hypothetical protein